MRIVVINPDGTQDFGRNVNEIIMGEQRCKTPAEVRTVIAAWLENGENFQCPFTLTNSEGEEIIWPHELIIHCKIRVIPGVIKDLIIPKSQHTNALMQENDHGGMGIGYQEEEGNGEESAGNYGWKHDEQGHVVKKVESEG